MINTLIPWDNKEVIPMPLDFTPIPIYNPVIDALNQLKENPPMPPEYLLLHWINAEIPAYLDKFNSFTEFDKAMPSAAASVNWKKFAYAMAKERWNVPEITYIPA